MRTYITKPRLSASQYKQLRALSHDARALRNEAIKLIEAHYDKTRTFLHYNALYHAIKTHSLYKRINSNMSQLLLRNVVQDYVSFFELAKLKKTGAYDRPVRPPRRQTRNAFSVLYINRSQLGINNQRRFRLPAPRGYYQTHEPIWFTIPKCIDLDKLRHVQIVPQHHARFFHVHYVVEETEMKDLPSAQRALGIDLGINNLATCASSTGDTFILDGRRLKSHNQYVQKELSKIRRLKAKQNHPFVTQREYRLRQGHKHRVKDIIDKTGSVIVNYCLKHDIDTLVVGYNQGFQQGSRLGRRVNQQFSHHQFGQLRSRLNQLCRRHGLNYVEQEESYTSQASFFDSDPLPVFNPRKKNNMVFSGRRVQRGRYVDHQGNEHNADVNAALNILRKSNLLDRELTVLQSRCRVNRPIRIRVA